MDTIKLIAKEILGRCQKAEFVNLTNHDVGFDIGCIIGYTTGDVTLRIGLQAKDDKLLVTYSFWSEETGWMTLKKTTTYDVIDPSFDPNTIVDQYTDIYAYILGHTTRLFSELTKIMGP